MKRLIVTLSLVLSVMPAAHAALTWQPAPPDAEPQAAGGHAGHGSSRGGKAFVLLDGEGAEAQMWLPTRVRRPLHVGGGASVSVGGSGLDNYHLLFARKRLADGEEVALRYLYQHGKPSGESPSSLIEHEKCKLDIIPAPLTREHQRYLSLKSFRFLVRFNGKPLADHPIVLTTSHGSESVGTTGPEGYVTLTLPDDFDAVQPGRRSNAPAEFVVTTAHTEQSWQYRTTLSAPYYVNPSHWRSTFGGLAAMFAGVVVGAVVLRRSSGNERRA